MTAFPQPTAASLYNAGQAKPFLLLLLSSLRFVSKLLHNFNTITLHQLSVYYITVLMSLHHTLFDSQYILCV